MKGLKITQITVILVINLIGYSSTSQEQEKGSLEDNQMPTTLVFESEGLYRLKPNFQNKVNMDTLQTYNGITYHIFSPAQSTICLIIKSKKENKWKSRNFEIISMDTKTKEHITTFGINHFGIKSISLGKKIIYNLNNGNVIEYFGVSMASESGQQKVLSILKDNRNASDNQKQSEPKNKTYNRPNLEEFEYSEHWREEAYKATKKYLQWAISEKELCNVLGFGKYQPYLLRYLGNYKYRVKIYCEFDCGDDYNNPSHFWVEVYYKGNNTWDGEIIKQKFVD
ncbi:hypothetical protein [Snuella lapsa]|uniref:Uncharacterized protein n=1 Tax=Snuella lapsa TaxID=870481 RepID=A0ABP6YFB8_9FLAO